MTSWNITAVLFIIGGLLLLTNPIWLFPNEGGEQYTYQRVPIVVENGTLTYDFSDCEPECEALVHNRKNDLNPVDCQPRDTHHGHVVNHDCLFDEYLVNHGPIRLMERNDHLGPNSHAEPRFVQLDDTYYRRIYRPINDSTVTVDVERVPPRELLAAVAENFTGFEAHEFSYWEYRLAVTGGTTSISHEPDDDDLGNVYYRNGTYYTILVVNTENVGYPLGHITRFHRLEMMAVGGLLQIGVAMMFVYDEWIG